MLQAAKFKDSQLEDKFRKNGYIYIEKFIDKETVNKLLQRYKELHNSIDKGKNQWNSLYDIGAENGMETSDFIKSLITPQLENYFDNFDYPVATFMSKNPNKGSTCKVHRDFTTFNEIKIELRNIWIPLVDITQDNGALYVIPGSHHLFSDIRPMFSEWEYQDLAEDILKYQKTVYPQAGDLILYADRTLHGSWENFTSISRPVIHGGIIPKDSPLYYFEMKDYRVRKYKVDFEFYQRHKFNHPDISKHYELVEEFDFHPKKISLSDIHKLKEYSS